MVQGYHSVNLLISDLGNAQVGHDLASQDMLHLIFSVSTQGPASAALDSAEKDTATCPARCAWHLVVSHFRGKGIELSGAAIRLDL
jgi:hypothetical protein